MVKQILQGIFKNLLCLLCIEFTSRKYFKFFKINYLKILWALYAQISSDVLTISNN